MKRTNDQVGNNDEYGGESDVSKKAKVLDKESGNIKMISREQSAKGDPDGGDYNGMAMANPSFSIGNPMMMNGAIGELKRTIYLGGITKDISPREIFDVVKTGAVESLRLLPQKGCAFLCFVDPVAADLFYQNATARHLKIHDVEVKLGWGKSNPILPSLQLEILRGASRTVFINRLASTMDSDYLVSALSVFGEIEMVKILKEKQIAFVYFTSISSAVKCVNALSNDPAWKNQDQNRRISYGRDRCAQKNQTQQQQPYQQQQLYQQQQPYQQQHQHQQQLQLQQQQQFQFQLQLQQQLQQQQQQPRQQQQEKLLQTQLQQNQPLNVGQFQFGLGNYGGQQGQAGNVNMGMPYPDTMDRTIYIGNLQTTDTCEDICSAIRGGLVYRIKHMKEKCTAFVTFVEPYSATLLHAHGNTVGLVINNRRVKVGWGKPTPISYNTLTAIQNGATRNIYLGSVEQPIPEEQLRQDFSTFGELEMVKNIPEKKCCFINFTCISSAMRARNAISHHASYCHFKVNYGKDPCTRPFTIGGDRLQRLQRKQQDVQQQDEQQQANQEPVNGKDKEKEKKPPVPVHEDFKLPLK